MEFNELLDRLIPEVTLEAKDSYSKPLVKEIGSMVRAYRKRRGISQIQLSRKSGISQANISKFENGEYNISLSQLERLIRALNAHIVMEVKPNE
ncbi:MAG: helix-turn-helix transcriptional regulator [Bacilli bacterium]|nr:helix-turn-helix transcriptional regulator [Bacilli bacterium]